MSIDARSRYGFLSQTAVASGALHGISHGEPQFGIGSNPASLIGSACFVQFSGATAVQVPCTIADVRKVYGRTDYLIVPNGGSGQTWIDSSRARLV